MTVFQDKVGSQGPGVRHAVAVGCEMQGEARLSRGKTTQWVMLIGCCHFDWPDRNNINKVQFISIL